MTKLIETNYVITLSKAVRERDEQVAPKISDETLIELENIITELAGEGIVVEISAIPQVTV